MFLRRLALTNFRCYRHLDLTLPNGTVVVVGRNAQGKTSLLEAIYLLATTRSPSASSDREFIHWDAGREPLPFARVWGEVARGGEAVRIEVRSVRQAPDDGDERYTKRVEVNHAPRRALDVIGLLTVVLFTPRDLEIVAGAPAERRRYLDVLLCQIDHAYCRSLTGFNQVLTQRNHLLRRLRDRGGRPDELAFWDERLAQHGAYVVERRAAAVAALSTLAAEVHAELAGAPDRARPLSIAYLPGLRAAAGDPAQPVLDGWAGPTAVPAPPPARAELTEGFRASLAAGRADDIARGATQSGPHRDELAFTLGGIDMRTYGSRGQQRTVALALKLAEAQLMWSDTGERPVILLDDVLSELDPDRRRHVMARVDPQQQTLITATDLGGLPAPLPDGALVLHVEAAAVAAAERDGRAVTPPVGREPERSATAGGEWPGVASGEAGTRNGEWSSTSGGAAWSATGGEVQWSPVAGDADRRAGGEAG